MIGFIVVHVELIKREVTENMHQIDVTTCQDQYPQHISKFEKEENVEIKIELVGTGDSESMDTKLLLHNIIKRLEGII